MVPLPTPSSASAPLSRFLEALATALTAGRSGRPSPAEAWAELRNLPGGELCDEAPLPTGKLLSDLPESLADIALLFEESIPATAARRDEIVYTPPNLARRMVTAALPDPASPVPPILDPACGSGIFLLTLYEALRDRTPAATPAESLAPLHGLDLDPRAVAAAKLCLAVAVHRRYRAFPESARSILDAQVVCGNFLLEPGDAVSAQLARDAHACTLSAVFPEARAGFGLIIGNPPYGLSRGARIGREETSALKRRYRTAVRGRVNTCLLFIARALETARPGGTVSFVVPNAWLGIREAELLRRRLLTRGEIVELTSCGDVFPGLGVETVILRAQRDRHQPSFRVSHLKREAMQQVVSLTPGVCLRNPGAIIPLTWREETARIWEHLDRVCQPLGGPGSGFRPLIALQVYREGSGTPPQSSEVVRSHPFHSRTGGPGYVPYLRGRDVGRFSLTWSGEYLRYGPWVAEYHDLTHYSGARILIREVLGRWPHLLQAVSTTAELIYNRSVLHIRPTTPAAAELLPTLLAVLNSPFASWIMRTRGRKSQRHLFPKIVLQDLVDFPLPRNLARSAPLLTGLITRREVLPSAIFERELATAVLDAYELEGPLRSLLTDPADPLLPR